MMGEKRNVPKLRFSEFSEPWVQQKIEKGFELVSGQHLNPEEYSERSNPNAMVPYFTGPSDFTSLLSTVRKWALKSTKTSKINDLLFTVKGNGVGTMMRQMLPEVAIGRQLMALRSRNGSTSFLQQRLQPLKNYYIALASGNMIPGLTRNDLLSTKIYTPPFPEQKKIASFLTAVDTRIELLEQKKEKLERYKKGVMQQIFTQNIRFKQEDGLDFPDWEERKLGEVLQIGSGRDYKHLLEGPIPVYGTGGLIGYVNDFLYNGESVGIGRKGTIDKPVFISGKFWTVDTLFYTYDFKDVLPDFIYRVFLMINWKKHNEASGVPSLSKSTIQKLKILIPCIQEQQKISDFLRSLDNSSEKLNNRINQTQIWKKGLLQKMFV